MITTRLRLSLIPFRFFMQIVFASVRKVKQLNLFSLVSFCVFVFHSAYCGGLWLASLCAMCMMARLVDNEEKYRWYRDILDRGSAAFDKLLWNGEFQLPFVEFNMYMGRVYPAISHFQLNCLRLEMLCFYFHFPFPLMFRQVLQL